MENKTSRSDSKKTLLVSIIKDAFLAVPLLIGFFIFEFILQVTNRLIFPDYSKIETLITGLIVLSLYGPYKLGRNLYFHWFIDPLPRMEYWQLPQIHQTMHSVFGIASFVFFWWLLSFIVLRIRRAIKN